jgi:prolipoprotein diacylglyceryltransferase
MGIALSAPMVLIGAAVVVVALRRPRRKVETPPSAEA